MEQVLLGIIIFNAFFMPSELKYDTIEVSQVSFKQNKDTELNFGQNFNSIEGFSIGSRTYSQATPWLRYGQGTYLYQQTSSSLQGQRKLKQQGGYVGFLAEVHYKRYFGLGVLLGGGASNTEFNDGSLNELDRSNYFLLAKPYLSMGLPLTSTASVNLIASTYIVSEAYEKIDGSGQGFEAPHNLDSKLGLEFVWSWK